MSERVFPSSADTPAGFPGWSAIWAGTFAFVAIWSVFGFLGAAIFASVVNPASSMADLGFGLGIWAVVLMIIAMFAAGRTAGRMAGRIDALMAGTVTFGLSVTAALVIASLTRLAVGSFATTVGALGISGAGMHAGLGWAGFIALFLGWVAAVGGTYSAAKQGKAAEMPTERIRAA